MAAGDASKVELTSVDLHEADERYHFKLSEILRKRHLPLMLVINHEGELQYSSVPDSAQAHEHRLLGQALAEARNLFNSEFQTNGKNGRHAGEVVVEKPGERCALVMLDNEFHSLKLFPLHGPVDDLSEEKYAALVEPIVKPLSEGIDYKHVKARWRLSNREVDVLKALMSGDTDKTIAKLLEVSVETVRAYQKSIRAKLGVGTRTAIVHVVHEMNSQLHREDVSPRI